MSIKSSQCISIVIEDISSTFIDPYLDQCWSALIDIEHWFRETCQCQSMLIKYVLLISISIETFFGDIVVEIVPRAIPFEILRGGGWMGEKIKNMSGVVGQKIKIKGHQTCFILTWWFFMTFGDFSWQLMIIDEFSW